MGEFNEVVKKKEFKSTPIGITYTDLSQLAAEQQVQLHVNKTQLIFECEMYVTNLLYWSSKPKVRPRRYEG